MVILSLSTPLVEQSIIKVRRISIQVAIFHSFVKQKDATWSLCVVCIICSSLMLYFYTTWGLLNIAYIAHVRNTDWSTREDEEFFVAKGDKMVYTEKEKAALAVFTFAVLCSVIEIVLAAAMMKICDTTTKTPQLSSSCDACYQLLSLQYLPRIVTFEVSRSRSVIFLSSLWFYLSNAFWDDLWLLCRYFDRQDW